VGERSKLESPKTPKEDEGFYLQISQIVLNNVYRMNLALGGIPRSLTYPAFEESALVNQAGMPELF
jgi:hypothetical protein